jgi:glycosyltransferase involved in cell wall biosynthesis
MPVTLVWLNYDLAPLPSWPLGQAFAVMPEVVAINQWYISHKEPDEFYLFWDARLGNPPLDQVQQLSQQPEDVWHAGLCLGMAGLPHLIDFVNPVWQFNRDPDPQIEATSWRLSLQACLVRSAVLQQLGGLDARFSSLSGASLELGHRWLRQGAFIRHVPALAPANARSLSPPSLHDEFLFVRLAYGRLWHTWAFCRALATGHLPLIRWRAWWQSRSAQPPEIRSPLRQATMMAEPPPTTIAILIPTLDRYPYLWQLLDQLRQQTIRPHQIIVIDQTPVEQRQPGWSAQFSDLPLAVIWRDQPGQCTARNAGLKTIHSDYILFLDDDDVIPDDLIASHLAFLGHHSADASCGVAAEVDADSLPHAFTYPRASDVFPTNNALLKKAALYDSGLFDLAYERGSRADGDLGMRLYLAGKRLLLNPAAQVIHLHAPQGGLRRHNARATTRANSRASLTRRHLLEPTEAYLWLRYFSPSQVQEASLIRTLASLRGEGPRWKKYLRALLMAALLLLTYYQNQQRLRAGANMLKQYPQIPVLQEMNKVI